MRRASIWALSPLFFACGACSTTPAPTPPAPSPAVAATATPREPAPAASATPETPKPASTVAADGDATPDVKRDIAASTKATLDVFAKARKPGNLLFSGTSVRDAMGLAYLGARGATKKELAAAFGYPDPAAFGPARRAEAAAWEHARGKGAELTIATRVWTDATVHAKPDFATAAGNDAVAGVDFKGAPNDARKTINAWASEKTATKIPELLGEGAVDARTRAVIVNAVHFRGRWVFPFSETATKDEPFFLDAKKSVNAPLMHMTDTLQYGEAPGVKLAELRYLDSDLAFLVAVPDDREGLAKVEDALFANGLDAWTSALRPTRVDLTLPKFSFRAGGSLKPALTALGVKTTFADTADFGDMVDEKVTVSDVVQRTFIAVDEKGTEAAAATSVVMRATGAHIGKPMVVRADRPFLFFVRDVRQGRILFMGRLSSPKA